MQRRRIDRYELQRRLGAGASSVAYLANDTLLMRPVVLKIQKRGALDPEQLRATLLREARMASAIEHSNVCTIYAVGETADEAYIVMQYVPGRSLSQIIAQGPASIQLSLSIGIQLADGLAAAHALGIFHRDLKPANAILTDGGLVKILDFGLARRLEPEETGFDPAKSGLRPAAGAPTYTARGGTVAYMAPEQFVTGQSSAQSDIWALGVILYELVSGRHPFVRPDTDQYQNIHSIQFADPPVLQHTRPDLSSELVSVIARCLAKNPVERYAQSAEVREALKTTMKAHQLETGIIPGEAAAELPGLGLESERRSTPLLSMLAERFRHPAGTRDNDNTIVVLPLESNGLSQVTPLYGFALAEAIAARLARMPELVVRPTSASMFQSLGRLGPLEAGQKLMVRWVLSGRFLRSPEGFNLTWQLLDVSRQSVATGSAIHVSSFDLVAVQAQICDEVFACLQGVGQVAQSDRATVAHPALGDQVSEEYLQGRALLSAFMQRTGSQAELEGARERFERVVHESPGFSPAWSALGIAELEFVRHGFGGHAHVVSARRAFDQALELDPGAVEANLYRVYLLLGRGAKPSALHGIDHLLRTAPNDWNVHLVAGITLRLDGVYEAALEQFNRSLELSPSNAPVVYNHRARVYQYQNQLELAQRELDKGLTLEPRHPLLLTSSAYQRMRQGDLVQAIEILEAVIRDNRSLRIAYPTLAACYVQRGERERAAELVSEESTTAAEADGEMAYRLGTYFAVLADAAEALRWLRRAIYLGNENYPWFARNPAWTGLHGHDDFVRILGDLKKRHVQNRRIWRRLLSQAR